MINLKGIVVLAVMVVLVGASTAHAGKRLTTGSSGLSTRVECTVVNVSDQKTITVDIIVRTGSGGVATQALGIVLPPLTTILVVNTATDRRCEFVVVSGGSAKHLRGSMVVYDPDTSTVATIEHAREK